MALVGVDLGGTSCDGVVLNDKKLIVCRYSVPTRKSKVGDVLETVSSVVQFFERKGYEFDSFGLGMPGVYDSASAEIANSNIRVLNGSVFISQISERVEKKIAVANDASCFGLSEWQGGALTGCENAVGVTLGTGVGFSLILNGALYNGANFRAGEWSHTPLPARSPIRPSRRMCHCGSLDCIETYLSGEGFRATVAQNGIAGETQYASDVWSVLESLHSLLDVEAFALGGGMSELNAIRMQLETLGSQRHIIAPIKWAKYGKWSGARGAALLAEKFTLGRTRTTQ